MSNVNYIGIITNLDFPTGEVQQTITIPLMDDGVITSNLTVNLALNPDPPAQYGNQPTAVLTIINDDSAVGFSSATYQVPKNIVNGVATINVCRIGSTNGTCSVVFKPPSAARPSSARIIRRSPMPLVTFIQASPTWP